jgi:hypothetical protein
MSGASKGLRVFTAAVAMGAFAACLTLMTDPAPSDGGVTLDYGSTRASIVLPVDARGRQIPSDYANQIWFANELGPDHTLGAAVSIHTLPTEQLETKSDEELLAWRTEQFERELPESPGRVGATLRTLERVGGTREPAPAQGAQCVEYLHVSEDRLVPGHKGEPFITHARDYLCIHPGTRKFVIVHISERFPMDRAQLRPTFEEDVEFLFGSLRLH